MEYLVNQLKIGELSESGQQLVEKYFWLTLFSAILGTLSSTFLYLHVIDRLGYTALGTIMAIMFLVSAGTDFPTGVLADWLGHKWVLSIAYVLFSISYVLIAFANGFSQFVIAFIILALANGQASGALQSWFDNNYKRVSEKEDPKREIYREFMGSGIKYFQISSSIFFVLGGLVATLLNSGRELVFGFQGICMLIMAGVFIQVLDSPEIIEEPKEAVGYFALLFDGIKFAFSSKLMIFLVLSSVIMTTVGLVWYSLILFPIYFGYTGNDLGAGILRWVIWFGGAILAGKAGKFAKSKDEKTWLPLSNLLSFLIFFGLTLFVVMFIPIKDQVNVYGILFITVIFITASFYMTVSELLMQKFLLEVIPDDKRNSLYSLLPTLAMILGAPIIYLIGQSVDSLGFDFAIFLFVVLSMLGVLLQYISMSDYTPKVVLEEIELPYDVYSITNFDRFSFHIPKVWQVSTGVKVIWEDLMETAMDDGTISEDELSILHSVMNNLRDYGEAVERALEDHVITEEEKAELLKINQKLIQDVESTIMQDGIVTHEEMNLLNRLARVMNEIIIDRIIEEKSDD